MGDGEGVSVRVGGGGEAKASDLKEVISEADASLEGSELKTLGFREGWRV